MGVNSIVYVLALVSAVGFVITVPAHAEDPDAIALSLGYFDVVDRDNDAMEFRAEYHSDIQWMYFKPFAGGTITTDKAVLLYAGIYSDFHFSRNWIMSPSIAPAYFSRGDGKNLGYKLVFRSQLEVAYQFADYSRIGLSFNHISNAGLGDTNNGSESIAVTYSFSLRK